MQILNQDIKEKKFRPVYLLYGEESYLKQSYKKHLREAVVADDTINYTVFEGKGIDVGEVIAMADTMPFFSEKRLILIEDSGFFKSTPDGLTEYLDQMPDTACLVFVEEQVDKRNKLYKKVKEMGYAAELNHQSPEQLSRWAATILIREGKKITNHTMEYFLSMVGEEMDQISMELEKIICYTMGREVVTEEDINAVCTVRVVNHIFDMIAALAARNVKRALDLYEDLLILKEPPMRILFLIAKQFNQILQVKELMLHGMDKTQIAKQMKLQPFIAGKLMGQSRTFSREQILRYVESCVDLEEAVKTGRIADRLAVEILITQFRI